VAVRAYAVIGLGGVLLLALPGLLTSAEALYMYVPANDVTGTLSLAGFVFLEGRFDGDYCGGSRCGVLQEMIVVYADGGAVVPTRGMTTGGQPAGTRVTAPRDNGTDCTDSLAGEIREYSGVRERGTWASFRSTD
jgi:hypothetical protein